jgi:hypothetical protein
MHVLGFLGMPRRVYTYDDGLGWGGLNAMVSIGSVVFALGTGITLANWLWSARRGAPAASDPWGGDSLEWATTSPPPEYNFAAIPVVTSRHPLWEDEPLAYATSGAAAETSGLGREGAVARATPITSGVDTRPEDNLRIPAETILPFVLAVGLALLFAGLLVKAEVVGVAGVGLAIVGAMWWTWRTEEDG